MHGRDYRGGGPVTKQVIAWASSDGAIWETREEAEKHDVWTEADAARRARRAAIIERLAEQGIACGGLVEGPIALTLRSVSDTAAHLQRGSEQDFAFGRDTFRLEVPLSEFLERWRPVQPKGTTT